MFGRAWAPRLRANRSSAHDFTCFFIHRDSLSNSCDFMFLHLLRGDLDWQQMRVSYGAPGSMLEQEWIGLHFPYLGWHNDPSVGVNKKGLDDWIGTFNVDTISEEILDRYSYTPVREFQATGCEDWCKENSRRHVSNILSNEPYFVFKGLVVPHVISVHYSHDMPLVHFVFTVLSPCFSWVLLRFSQEGVNMCKQTWRTVIKSSLCSCTVALRSVILFNSIGGWYQRILFWALLWLVGSRQRSRAMWHVKHATKSFNKEFLPNMVQLYGEEHQCHKGC